MGLSGPRTGVKLLIVIVIGTKNWEQAVYFLLFYYLQFYAILGPDTHLADNSMMF